MTYPMTPEAEAVLTPEQKAALQSMIDQGDKFAPDLTTEEIVGLAQSEVDYQAAKASPDKADPMPQGKADFPIGIYDDYETEDDEA